MLCRVITVLGGHKRCGQSVVGLTPLPRVGLISLSEVGLSTVSQTRGRENNVTLAIETISTEALFALAAVVENPISTFSVGMTRMLTIATEVNWKYIVDNFISNLLETVSIDFQIK